jgi:hypothetical protein
MLSRGVYPTKPTFEQTKQVHACIVLRLASFARQF